MERKALVALAKELNKVMGLEPRIKTNQKKDKIEEQIFQAIDLITEDDVFSEEAETMIRILLKKSGEPEEMQQDEEPEDEEPEDEAEELNEDEVEIEEAKETNEDEPEEVGIEEAEGVGIEEAEEAEGVGIEEAEEAEKDGIEAEKKSGKRGKRGGKQPTTKVNRMYAAGVAIQKGEGKSIKELAKDTDKFFIKHGGKTNLKESMRSINRALKVLEGYGVIIVEDGAEGRQISYTDRQ